MADGRLADTLAQGRIANLDQVASARESVVHGGAAHGCRALDLRVYGGIDVRILPDRGFDLSDAWYRGVPFSWTSLVGETAPLSDPRGMAWLQAFGGGLVVTCGLQNVGAPSEGHGLHGRFSHLRAANVRVDRRVEGGEIVLDARATLEETEALGMHLRVDRTVMTRTGRGLVEVEDRTRNLLPVPVEAPFLYHVNLGAPLWEEPARLELASKGVTPRDEDAQAGLSTWQQPPQARAGAPERVFEHDVQVEDGWARAAVVNPVLDLRVEVAWDATTLPRLWQWVHPASGVYSLGLEPANCSVLGRGADRAAGRLPVLQPGEERITRLRVSADRVS